LESGLQVNSQIEAVGGEVLSRDGGIEIPPEEEQMNINEPMEVSDIADLLLQGSTSATVYTENSSKSLDLKQIREEWLYYRRVIIHFTSSYIETC
jgi:hypothetical protein